MSVWSANVANGKLDSILVAGKFENGWRHFFGYETYSERWVMVRFIFSARGQSRCMGSRRTPLTGENVGAKLGEDLMATETNRIINKENLQLEASRFASRAHSQAGMLSHGSYLCSCG